MLSDARKEWTTFATMLTATAACVTVTQAAVAAIGLRDPLLAFPIAAGASYVGVVGNAIRSAQKNSQYKRFQLPPSDSIESSPLPPPKNTETHTTIVWSETNEIKRDKTKSYLLVPEGYTAETLASEPFRAALQRYQDFLQQHFPAELITVGIAYPEESIPSVTPDAKWGYIAPTQHPLLEKTDALLILLNGEQYRLNPHASPQDQIAVSWGPSEKGVADLEMLSTALHECFHLCSTGGSPYINDSYKHDLSPKHIKEKIDSFNHTGFLPHIPREDWPDTPVTRAIKAFDVPLFPHTEGDKRYWAVSDRYNVMDRSSQVENNPLRVIQ